MRHDEWKNKLCLTSVIRFPFTVGKEISTFLEQFTDASNDLFFYPINSFHTTVLGLIELRDEISFTEEEYNILKQIFVQVCISIQQPLLLYTDGMGKTPASLYVRLHDKHDSLNHMREQLIIAFKDSRLNLDIDFIESYNLGFNWCTVIRTMDDTDVISSILKEGQISFGSFEATTVDIVITDKYFSENNTQKIFPITIGEAKKTAY